MSGSAPRPHRVAIVGTGPSGFYAAQALLRLRDFPVAIDLFDRLPTPFGLVRGGVAPDHQHIKAVTRTFSRIADRASSLRFFGNVRVGHDVGVGELAARYDAVVWAVGCEGGRTLGLPGEALAGVMPAAPFVFWYNGHPDYTDVEVDLSRVQRAMVVGNGNVALDVARMLVHRPETLAATDVADHALDRFRRSAVESVHVLGRRGPLQASFTLPELRELAQLPGTDLVVDREDVQSDAVLAALQGDASLDPNERRILELLVERAEAGAREAQRALHLRFQTSVVRLEGDEQGRVSRVWLTRNALVPRGDRLSAEPVGEPWAEPAQLVLTAIGYRRDPLPDLPYDERAGVIPNDGGRVQTAPGGERLPGHYVTGWARRGPSGVVGTNKPDAREVVAALWEDLRDAPQPALGPDVAGLLAERGVAVVDFEGWGRIDAAEVQAGAETGRPRVKITDWGGLLEAARTPP